MMSISSLYFLVWTIIVFQVVRSSIPPRLQIHSKNVSRAIRTNNIEFVSRLVFPKFNPHLFGISLNKLRESRVRGTNSATCRAIFLHMLSGLSNKDECVDGMTLLSLTVLMNERWAMVETIKAGADVNETNSEGKSVIFLALARKNILIMNILILNGADVNAVDSDNMPLLFHAFMIEDVNDRALFVEFLIDSGAIFSPFMVLKTVYGDLEELGPHLAADGAILVNLLLRQLEPRIWSLVVIFALACLTSIILIL